MNVAFLISLDHYDAFLARRSFVGKFDTIFVLKNPTGLSEVNKRNVITGVANIVSFIDKNKIDRVLFFDYSPIYLIFFYKYFNSLNIEAIYVQHGHYDVRLDPVSIRLKFKNFIWNLRLTLSLILNFGVGVISLRTLAHYFLWGAYKSLRETGAGFRIDKCFVWSKADEDLVRSFENVEVVESVICGGPDSFPSSLWYEREGPMLYISQPLAQEKLMSNGRFLKLLEMVAKKCPNVLFLKHPKLILSEPFDKFPWIEAVPQEGLGVSGIIGHFSSLLLYQYEGVPVTIDHFGFNEIIPRVNSYKADLSARGPIEYRGFDDAIARHL